MSLDVYLKIAKQERCGSGIFIRENGVIREITHAEWDEKFPSTEPVVAEFNDNEAVYWANITHNLGKMAGQAGIYEYLWRPDEIGVTIAAELIDPLTAGLALLKSDRARFEVFNPSNGWGNYDVLVKFTEDYLAACVEYSSAVIEVSR